VTYNKLIAFLTKKIILFCSFYYIRRESFYVMIKALNKLTGLGIPETQYIV